MIHLFNDNSPLTWHIPADNLKHNRVRSLAEIHASVAGFSAFLLKQNTAREHPEIVALAFWFRQAHLAKITAAMPTELNNKKVHRVFHIAPANVDTVFMYSVLLSVLCANKNIVRVSQRSGEVTWLLISLLQAYLALPEGQPLAPLVAVAEYGAEYQQVTEQLSQWCDLRVVWGGDNAIAAISAIAPATPQVCFPDRYSVAVLELNDNADFSQHARGLLADLLPFTQQACSSPKALYWLNTPAECQRHFWRQVEIALQSQIHQFEMRHKVEQHILLQTLAAGWGLILASEPGNNIASFAKVSNIGPISHCKVKTLTTTMLEAHSGNGLLLEQDITTMNDIACSARLQTISYAVSGEPVPPKGDFKRMVPSGSALVFAPVWDGVDLLDVFW